MIDAQSTQTSEGLFGLDRCKALSDGVIAIVITLLILGIDIPKDHSFSEEGLLSFLRKIGFELFVYGVSFWLAGVYWVQHCAILHFFRRASRMFLWLNLLFLFPVTLLPFVTKLKSVYKREELIVMLFAGLQVLIGVTLLLLWRYAVTHPRLLLHPIVPGVRRSMALRILVSPMLISLLAAGVSYVSIEISTLLFLSIPIYSLSHRLVDSDPAERSGAIRDESVE